MLVPWLRYKNLYTNANLQKWHISKDCQNKRLCNVGGDHAGGVCWKIHYRILHNLFMYNSMPDNACQAASRHLLNDGFLLMVSNVKCQDQVITTLWDLCSSMFIIMHMMASRFWFNGSHVNLTVTKAGNRMQEFQSNWIRNSFDAMMMYWKLELVVLTR